jgi:ABC-2 type transport system permease protein
MRVVGAIFYKDILDGIKNYQILLIVLTPIFLSVLFNNLYKESRSKTMLPKLGVIGLANHPLLGKFQSENSGVKLSFFSHRQEMEAKIIEGEIGFGIILPSTITKELMAKKRPKLTLVYPAGIPQYIVERMEITLEQQVRQFFNVPPPPLPIEFELSPVGGDKEGDRAFSNDFFPMLILMAMGMVGFLGMPLSFVEEKEKKTLNAIFLTPTTANELIWGKSLFGLSLTLFTVLTMVTVNNRWSGNFLYISAFVFLGAVFCLFIGLIIAMYSESQGSVNACGTTLFMAFQLIPNLSQSSELMKALSPLVPSTFIGRGLKKALFLDLSKVDIFGDLAVVTCWALGAYLCLFLVLRSRSRNR